MERFDGDQAIVTQVDLVVGIAPTRDQIGHRRERRWYLLTLVSEEIGSFAPCREELPSQLQVIPQACSLVEPACKAFAVQPQRLPLLRRHEAIDLVAEAEHVRPPRTPLPWQCVLRKAPPLADRFRSEVLLEREMARLDRERHGLEQ